MSDSSIGEARKWLVRDLVLAGIDEREARREADLILQHCTGKTLAQQLAAPEESVGESEMERLADIRDQRIRRVPLQYCLGESWFMGLRFQVSRAVLIPRPETELLVETALSLMASVRNPQFEDVGTGSGAIAVSILLKRPDARALAIEKSAEALAVAETNARFHDVDDRTDFILADWLVFEPQRLVDAIIANPPYVPLSDKTQLQPEVAVFEPGEAIFGIDEDGLGFYRYLSARGFCHLKPGGFLAVEVGQGQADAVAEILADCNWENISVRPDLNRIPRVVSAFRAATPIENLD